MGRVEIWARQMDEDGAAFIGYHGVVVMSDHDNQVIYIPIEPEVFMGGREWLFNISVVVGRGGVITPATGGRDCLQR